MLKKIQKTVFYALVVYATVGFLVVPYVLKSQIVQIVQKEVNAKLNVDSIYFNPFLFKLKISGVELISSDNKHLISLKSILVDLELYSLINSAIHIKSFILEKPEIFLVYNKNKTVNLSNIVKPSRSKTEIKDSKKISIPRIIIDKIAIENGTLNYEDFTNKNKFDFSFHDIGFELKNIDTDDFNTSDAQFRFYSSLGDGGFVDLKTKVKGFKPLALEGSLDFQASKIYTQWRYIQDKTELEVADGELSFYTDYKLNLDDLNSTTLYNLHASLENLRVKPKGNHKDVLNLESLYIQDSTVKPMLKKLEIKKIALNSLNVKIKRDSKKHINWLTYLKSKVDNSELNTSATKEGNSSAWDALIDNIALEKIRVDFEDEGIKPKVRTRVNELNFYMQNVTLLGEKPLTYQINMSINDTFKCRADGTLKHKVLDADAELKCSGFNVIDFLPYIDEVARKELKVYDVKLKKADVDFDANLSIVDSKDAIVVNVDDSNLHINHFVLNKRSTREKLLSFDSFDVNSVSLNTKTQNVIVGKVALNGLDIEAKRLRNGSLNVENLIVVKKKKSSKKIKQKSIKKKKYKLLLKHFALNSASFNFNDKLLSPSVKSKIDKITLNAYNINSKKNSWLKYNLSMRINSKGFAKSKGGIRHTPLKQKGTIELKKISLQELTPYIQESAYISLDDGSVSLKAKTKYEKSKTLPDLKVDGSMKIEDIFVSDSRDKTSLVSFNEIDLNSFNFEISPNNLFINEANLKSFYLNALVNKNKSMNFTSLAKRKEKLPKTEEKQNAKTKPKAKQESQTKFPLRILTLNVANGSAKFADNSLPIKFKTDIHDLNGVMYNLSNEEIDTSYVDITGEVDKYGYTSLKGSIDTKNPKIYTDLDFNFENLNLNAVSGYSASFAGYKIDSGKLDLSLGYKILDSELLGKNSIIIKKIKLGEAFHDGNSTTLPLGLAIALLEDSNGVIDINMPVAGNLDEPDFKYGALIFKTFVKLIVQAVTSPFRFLGSMLGISSDDLEFVNFNPGLKNILPPQREKLDSIATMLSKREKLSLSITGVYDVEIDKQALQKEKLLALAIKNKQSIMDINFLETIYEDSTDNKELDKIKENLEKEYKGKDLNRVYLTTLTQECINLQTLAPNKLKELATQRANTIKEYLVKKKNIDSSRINALNIASVNERDKQSIKTELKIEVVK